MSEKRRFAMGDCHGNFKAVKQVLERSGFNYDTDLLISLGDIADGYPEVPEIIEEFLQIKNFTWVLGNHDEWVQNWFSGKTNMRGVGKDGRFDPVAGGFDKDGFPPTGVDPDAHMWLSQGGRATFLAYLAKPELISKHRDFWLTKPVLYHVLDRKINPPEEKGLDSGGMCFVHAGWPIGELIAGAARKYAYYLYWDRSFWSNAKLMGSRGKSITTPDNFDKIFIGHTSTTYTGSEEPMTCGIVTNLDTGGGWEGKVCLMDIDTMEYWQSDPGPELYPGHIPRG